MMSELSTIRDVGSEIELAKTPEEANVIRAKIDAARRLLPQIIKDRLERFGYAFEGNWAYIEASIKAGELWNSLEDKRGRGERLEVKSQKIAISATDAGFASSQDATICSRLAEMDEEDIHTYKEDCRDSDKLPTLGGLYRWWKELFGVEDEGRPWLRVYNVWNFGKLDDRFGIGYPGNIPGQINMNLNYYYTAPGDLIVDLFAGGGTTLDVCKWDDDDFGNRQCLAYDIEPARPDIIQWDLVKDGLPTFEDARLIFLDPPYWKQKKGDYSIHETNLANLGLDEFHVALTGIIQNCLSRADYVALIIGSSEFLGGDRRGKDHASEVLKLVKGELIQRIIVPYTTQQYAAHDVIRAKGEKYMLNLYRDLMIWKKNL
jgi:hypothetical protein